MANGNGTSPNGAHDALPDAPSRWPWEQQPREAPRAYAYFCRYRDMDPAAEKVEDRRSLANLGRMLGVSTHLMEIYSSKWHWMRRVTAWDAYQDKLKREAHQRAVQDMADRHARMASTTLAGLMLPMNVLAARMRDERERITRELEALDTPNLIAFARNNAAFIDLMAKMERTARGQATERIAVQIQQAVVRQAERLGIPPEDILRRAQAMREAAHREAELS